MDDEQIPLHEYHANQSLYDSIFKRMDELLKDGVVDAYYGVYSNGKPAMHPHDDNISVYSVHGAAARATGEFFMERVKKRENPNAYAHKAHILAEVLYTYFKETSKPDRKRDNG